MARVIWTPQALRHLSAIGEYLDDVSPARSESLLDALVTSVELLERFPRSGRMVPEFQTDTVRELIREQYRLIYEVGSDTIWVVAVLHASRDITNWLSSPER